MAASPPKDKNSDSPSPPPPPSPSSSTSPPPSSSSSPPPPSSSSQSPPPPAKASAPPPENDGQSQSPPPPPKNSDSPPSNNSPPPPSDSSNSSPPPPPPPPPPVSSNSSPSRHSPPPPLSHRTPPSSTSGSSSSKSSSTNQEALIAGVAAGAGLLLIIMILLLVCCCRKKKRKPHDQMHYYSDNYHGNKIGSNYYNSGQHANWNAAGNGEHAVMMPPPPDPISSAQWPAVPPPPPPQVVSSEMSSTGYSGPHHAPLPPPHPALALGFNKSTFTYEDLAAATGGFAKANLLGQGGFGYVHKGVLPNGKEIAVKSRKSGSGQGEREFQAEVDIISRVHHRHLVSLVGYCIADSQRMLVYEFVPNSSLEHHLYGKGVQAMDFPARLKIALGSAKGFAYLHEDCHPRIIHRDIKAANILLDDNFEAMVADFGLAKLSNDTHTHVSTRIMGTFGYLAPEYASSGKLTEKSDVYSYGVVLLELITGRRPVDISSDDDSLVDWARPILVHAIEGGSYEELVDPRLENNYDPQEMLRMVACAAACIRHSARRRPRMSQIVRALEGDVSLEDLNEGVKPGHSSVFGSSGSSEYDGSYSTEIKRFRKTALASQEFTSSEHGVNSSSGGESQEIRPRGSRRNSP